MLKWLMFILYIILCVYTLQRIVHWLKVVAPLFKHKRSQAVVIAVYLCLAATVILGGLLPYGASKRFWGSFGNYWLGTFIFMLLSILVSDICTIILKLIHRRKKLSFMEHMHRYYIAGIAIVVFSASMSTFGSFHVRNIKVKKYDITVDKEADGLSQLDVVLIADLHMGYNMGTRQLQRMVDKINKEKPDVVLIAGDIFDNSYDSIENPEKMIEIFTQIDSRYGVYAVYGNHDVNETLVGGFPITSRHEALRDSRMDEFLRKANVTVLEDEVVTIADNQVSIIGRLDNEKAGDGTSNRLSLDKLMEEADTSKLVIDLEHEPVKLEEVADCGVDVMLSGHTHGGQFFPLTIVQPFVWDNYHGMKKIDDMYSFVTYGVGVYGPNMRVFTNSEIMKITIHFEDK